MLQLSIQQQETLLKTLELRFEKNMNRHEHIEWNQIYAKLIAQPEKVQALYEMEETGGEPDEISTRATNGDYWFYDCSPESPAGRRSFAYDREGQFSRKEHQPTGNAIDRAEAMGITLLTEVQYRELQSLGTFDMKTSSWIKTPESIRKLGGALFCDFRYNTVFVYHNGAQSYYAARGFRGALPL
jgi:hypothetical protein